MSPWRSVKTEAIVLKKRTLLARDHVVTLLTEELGKVSAIAKGIRTITSRRASHLQTGSLVRVVFTRHHDAFYVQQSDLVSAFSSIRQDEQKMNILYAFFFILDKILPSEQQESSVYLLTKRLMVNLTRQSTVPFDFLQAYLQELLQVLGYVEKERSLAELIEITEEIINANIPLRAIM